MGAHAAADAEARVKDWLAAAYWRTSTPISE